jgi:hypothetical protein
MPSITDKTIAQGVAFATATSTATYASPLTIAATSTILAGCDTVSGPDSGTWLYLRDPVFFDQQRGRRWAIDPDDECGSSSIDSGRGRGRGES